MKKSLRVIFVVLSFFTISTAMAQTCDNQQMVGGDVCFSIGTIVKNPLYTITMQSQYGNSGWSTGFNPYPFTVITGHNTNNISQVKVAAWGYGPVDVTSSYMAQCGTIVDANHTYNIVVNSTSPTNLSIVCTKQRVG